MQSLFCRARNVARRLAGEFDRRASGELKIFGLPINHPSHRLSSDFILTRNHGSRILSSAPSRSYSLASALPSYIGRSSGLNHSASSVFSLPSKSITTAESIAPDASVSSDVPQHVKFKRLDKTSRHIMQMIDKEAVEEVRRNREIPDIRPGYIVQLKVFQGFLLFDFEHQRTKGASLL